MKFRITAIACGLSCSVVFVSNLFSMHSVFEMVCERPIPPKYSGWNFPLMNIYGTTRSYNYTNELYKLLNYEVYEQMTSSNQCIEFANNSLKHLKLGKKECCHLGCYKNGKPYFEKIRCEEKKDKEIFKRKIKKGKFKKYKKKTNPKKQKFNNSKYNKQKQDKRGYNRRR